MNSFTWCSTVKFEQVPPEQGQSDFSIICKTPQQHSFSGPQPRPYKLQPLALVDAFLEHSSSFLRVVSALYPLSCLL